MIRGGIGKRNTSGVQKEPGTGARKGYERNEVVRKLGKKLVGKYKK